MACFTPQSSLNGKKIASLQEKCGSESWQDTHGSLSWDSGGTFNKNAELFIKLWVGLRETSKGCCRTLCLATEGLYQAKLEGARRQNLRITGPGEERASCTSGLPDGRWGLQWKPTEEEEGTRRGQG